MTHTTGACWFVLDGSFVCGVGSVRLPQSVDRIVFDVATMAAARRRKDQTLSKGAEETWKERDACWIRSDTQVLDVEAAERWDVLHRAVGWDAQSEPLPWDVLLKQIFEQEDSCGKLPVHPSLELFCIPKDPAWPMDLWKQKGLRVKEGGRIPAKTVLGTYAGWVGYEEEYKAMFPPVEAYGGDEARWIQGNSRLASYTVCCKHFSQQCPHPMGRLMIAAPGMGNWMAAINDGTWSPGSKDDVDIARNRPSNVGFLEVLHQGWPYMMVVTTRDVEAREEILVNYGEEYWEEYLDAMARAKSCGHTNGRQG